MKPDEVVQLLNEIGIPVSVPTLARYVRDGLISEPDRGGHGRGGGRWTEYSKVAAIEAATAWKLLNGKLPMPGTTKQTIRFSPGIIQIARSRALNNFVVLLEGSEGRKYISEEFAGNGNEYTRLAEDLNELNLSLKPEEKYPDEKFRQEAIIHINNTEKLSVPHWFPVDAWGRMKIKAMAQCFGIAETLYFSEYGANLLRMLPLLEKSN